MPESAPDGNLNTFFVLTDDRLDAEGGGFFTLLIPINIRPLVYSSP